MNYDVWALGGHSISGVLFILPSMDDSMQGVALFLWENKRLHNNLQLLRHRRGRHSIMPSFVM